MSEYGMYHSYICAIWHIVLFFICKYKNNMQTSSLGNALRSFWMLFRRVVVNYFHVLIRDLNYDSSEGHRVAYVLWLLSVSSRVVSSSMCPGLNFLLFRFLRIGFLQEHKVWEGFNAQAKRFKQNLRIGLKNNYKIGIIIFLICKIDCVFVQIENTIYNMQ